MAHDHVVLDADPHFTIDPITRLITNTSSKKVKLAQFDHNSEVFSFDIPRMVENHDLMLCDKVLIHYTNTDLKTKNENKGVYKVTDLKASTDDENTLVFTWTIEDSVTMYAGALSFSIEFKCTKDGETDYRWGTFDHTGITVQERTNNGEAIAKRFPDIFADWEKRISSLEENGSGHPVKYIESTKEDKVCLRDLESGIYILYGYFKPFPGSNSTIIVDNLLMHAYTGDDYTYMSCITADGIVSVYEILVDETNSYGYTYTRYRYKLDELAANAGSVKYVESMDENNIKNLLDLETGVYKLYGYFHPFPGSPSTMMIDNRIVTVEKQGEGSHFLIHTTTNGKIRFVEVLVDESNTYGYTEDIIDINLLDLPGAVQFKKPQSLTEEEKTQARKNIGAMRLPAPVKFGFSKIPSDIGKSITNMAYGNGRFVMRGTYDGNPVIIITTDFVNFKRVELPGGGGNLKFLNGKFIMTTTSSIKYSDDGETWTENALPVSGSWNDIAYGKGYYMIVSGDYYDAESDVSLYSTDLVTWHQAIMPVVDAWHAVEYGNGSFVAINYTGEHLAVFPTTTLKWTDLHGFGEGLFFNIYFHDGKFYIPISKGFGDGTNEILVGQPLEFERKVLPIAAQWQTMAFGAGYGIVFAHSSDGLTAIADACYTADGGETWEHIVMPQKIMRDSSTYGKGIFACTNGATFEFCNLLDDC